MPTNCSHPPPGSKASWVSPAPIAQALQLHTGEALTTITPGSSFSVAGPLTYRVIWPAKIHTTGSPRACCHPSIQQSPVRAVLQKARSPRARFQPLLPSRQVLRLTHPFNILWSTCHRTLGTVSDPNATLQLYMLRKISHERSRCLRHGHTGFTGC